MSYSLAIRAAEYGDTNLVSNRVDGLNAPGALEFFVRKNFEFVLLVFAHCLIQSVKHISWRRNCQGIFFFRQRGLRYRARGRCDLGVGDLRKTPHDLPDERVQGDLAHGREGHRSGQSDSRFDADDLLLIHAPHDVAEAILEFFLVAGELMPWHFRLPGGRSARRISCSRSPRVHPRCCGGQRRLSIRRRLARRGRCLRQASSRCFWTPTLREVSWQSALRPATSRK